MASANQSTSDFKGDHISVKMFGAKGDGTTDDTAAIQSAIDAITASAQNGANVNGEGGVTLLFPPGKYLVSAGLKFTHNGVILRGFGAAQIVAAASYSGTDPVIRMNPLDTIESSDQLRGCAICDLQVNVGAKPSISPVIEIRSASNCPAFRNLTVAGHTGTALRIGGESGAVQKVSEGLEFHNFYAWGGYQSGSGNATDDAVVIDETNEVTFYGGKVMYASSQSANTCAGVRVKEGTQAGAGIHFWGLSVDKYNRSVSITSTSVAPPWWIDFKGCTFEQFNHAIHVVGTSSQYIRFVSVDASNRFVSSQGSNPRKVYAEYVTSSSFAFSDSYDPNPSYTPGDPVVEMGAHATLNLLTGPASLVTGLGTNGCMSVDPSTGRVAFAGSALAVDDTNATFRVVNNGGSAANLSAQDLWSLLMTTTNHPLLLGANNRGYITLDPAALTAYVENSALSVRDGSYADICKVDPGAGVELYRPSGSWPLIKMKAGGSSSGDSIKWGDTQIGGQTYGKAYLEWVRDSGEGRKLRIVTVDNSLTQHTFEFGMTGDFTVDGAPLALPSVGTPGTYTKVTTDAQGRVTSGTMIGTSDLPAGVSIAAHDTFYSSRSSSIGTQTVSSLAAGRYLVCVNMGATASGSGSLQWTFSWVSGGVTRTIASSALSLTSGLTTSAQTATYPINVDAGTNLTYATSYVSSGSYEFSISVIKL